MNECIQSTQHTFKLETLVKMTTVLNSQAKLRPSASPIDILRNDSAKLYTHLHPVLVLSLYAYQFRSMVADPVLTLTRSLVPLSILQIAYVAICLPPTGSSGSSALQQERRKPGEKKKPTPGKVEVGINVKIIVRTRSIIAYLARHALTPDTARLPFSSTLSFGRNPASHRNAHTLWRAYNDPSHTYAPLRCTHCAALNTPARLRPWC
jgi:phosphatidylinositol glycan class F